MAAEGTMQMCVDNNDGDSTKPECGTSSTDVCTTECTTDPADTSQPANCHLLDLPSEIFLHIVSFLDAKMVIRTLSRVCKLYRSIISNDRFWKVRIRKRWPKKYPAIPVNDEEFDWKEACIEREEKHRLWSDPDQTMEYFAYTKGLYAPVDAVHLMKGGSLLAVGSRDRYLHILDLTKLRTQEPDSVQEASAVDEMDAHKSRCVKGWIWTIKSLDDTLTTGSWDSHIKFWDMATGCKLVQDVKLKSAVLCSHHERELYVAGCYDKKVYHIDPRCGAILTEKKYHKQPVLCLAVSNNYIVTGSEDSSVCVYDRRAATVLDRIQFESYPMSLSYIDDQMWVGDKGGNIHLIDATDGDFNIVDTYDVGHKGKVTSVISTLGATFTSSTDKTIKVLEPTVNPSVIKTLDKQTAEVARIDYQNDVMAIANSSVSVGIYRPRPSVVETW